MAKAPLRAPDAPDSGDAPESTASEPERLLPPRSAQQLPPPIGTMRAAVAEILAEESQLPRFDALGPLADRLRDHTERLIPAVETAAHALPDGHQGRAPALGAVEGARARLRADAGTGLVSATRHARDLARELRALCDHYEALAGAAAGEPA